ncbi:MAG: hypothetical protein M1484_03695 [Patescibacteria group bacterium]|nr:hypothetical protein [Patescibacteria group bacterium]MCL5432164.1 hypothetical protein [Patescibacteria group bacterium]
MAMDIETTGAGPTNCAGCLKNADSLEAGGPVQLPKGIPAIIASRHALSGNDFVNDSLSEDERKSIHAQVVVNVSPWLSDKEASPTSPHWESLCHLSPEKPKPNN